MSSERDQRSAPAEPGARAPAAGPAPGKQTRSEQGAPRGPAESTGSGARSLMRPEEWVRAEPWLPGPGLLAAMGLDGLEHGDGTGAAGATSLHQGTELAVPRPGRNQPGFIDHSDGANLRTGPAEAGGAKVVASPLPPATRVFVSGTHPSSPQWWYVTAFLDDEIVRGYVQDFRVTTALPEPTAKLHQIKSGDTAEGLAVREFKSAVRDGHDLRYYENVLLKVNRDRGRAGITGSFQAPGLFGGGSNNIQLVAGHRIWLVSPAYARSLEGEVPDGSLSNGGYAKVKRFAGHITDILQSVTQSPRFFPEVAGELAQAIADHLPLIIGVVAGFITLEAASALLAATPTGVGQIIAVLIQLLLAALGAQGMVEAGVQALQHGGRWLNLAWTAQGDEAKLAAASKEFLKMLVAIALAALAFAGAKANFGKALKISPAMPMPMPAMAIAGGGQTSSAGTAAAIGGPGPLSGVGPAGAMAVKHGDEGGTAHADEPGAKVAGASEESLDAWAARLKAQGVTGDIDKILARAKGAGADATAARGELRAAERAHRRGYEVEMLSPPEGPGAIQGRKTPEGMLTARDGGQRGLEAKTATAPPDRATWNAHADKANKQIKSLGKPGEISFDWTEVDIRSSSDFRNASEIEGFLSGKMTASRLREVKYFEIVWKDAEGVTKITSRVRNADGTVGPVVTKP